MQGDGGEAPEQEDPSLSSLAVEDVLEKSEAHTGCDGIDDAVGDFIKLAAAEEEAVDKKELAALLHQCGGDETGHEGVFQGRQAVEEGIYDEFQDDCRQGGEDPQADGEEYEAARFGLALVFSVKVVEQGGAGGCCEKGINQNVVHGNPLFQDSAEGFDPAAETRRGAISIKKSA